MNLDLSLLSLLEGDCIKRLPEIPDNSVDLVITSPPYAEQRKGKYNGVSEEKYVEWFIPIGHEIKRILKPTGSFLLNIKAHCDNGERSLYVYELIIALRKTVGLKYIDEYVWYKSASPRKKTFRLKNAWEPIYHFAKGKNYINHEAIKVRSESTFANKKGYTTYNDVTGNIGGYHDICTQQLGWTDPDNILYFPTSLLVKDKYPHPAKFPLELVDFLIRGFSPPDGVICDPFLGSGMTALASLRLGKKCYGCELETEYIRMIHSRLEQYVPVKLRDFTPNQLAERMNNMFDDV